MPVGKSVKGVSAVVEPDARAVSEGGSACAVAEMPSETVFDIGVELAVGANWRRGSATTEPSSMLPNRKGRSGAACK